MTGILTSIAASGLLRLRGVAGWEGWRWLFLVEGIITLIVGVASFFRMPASAVQTKAWFRPDGWFTEREEAIVVNRVLRDDPSKGDMHNREALTPRKLWEALTDYDLWPLYAIGLVAYIPQSPPKTYVTLILRNMGFSVFKTNLMTIPAVSSFVSTTTDFADATMADGCTGHIPHLQLDCVDAIFRMAQRASSCCDLPTSLDPTVHLRTQILGGHI